jgi:hypothetical protein
LVAPLIEVIKKNVGFKWGEEKERAFQLVKQKLTNAPLLALPILKRLKGAALNYPTYGKVLYALVRVI